MANLLERPSPLFHCPWLSVVAVLMVVGSIPPGIFFAGKSAVLRWIRKSARWVPTPRSGWGGGNPNSRAPGAGNRPFCVCSLGTRGRFFWRVGRFELGYAARDVNQRERGTLDVTRSQIPQVPSHWAVKIKRALWWLRCQKVVAVFAETGEQAKKAPKTNAKNRCYLNGMAHHSFIVCLNGGRCEWMCPPLSRTRFTRRLCAFIRSPMSLVLGRGGFGANRSSAREFVVGFALWCCGLSRRADVTRHVRQPTDHEATARS